MTVTPRKKAFKQTLLFVTSGLLLVKLGKNEYAVEPGQAFWLPMDCLNSVTYLPNTEVSRIEFSVRLADTFPRQAGYVDLDTIVISSIAKLGDTTIAEGYHSALLQVIRYEMANAKPELYLSKTSELYNSWSLNSQPELLNREVHLALKLREARKQILSGTKKDLVAERLFGGSQTLLDELSMAVLGSKL